MTTSLKPRRDGDLPPAETIDPAEAHKAKFRLARKLARANLAAMTPEEDAAITADAEADPDARPFTDEEWARAKKRFGRPPVENPKKLVSVRLDADVLAKLRADGAGWQTRMNAILRGSLGL